ncbi:hypothetical protein FA702_17035 [Novosphingobium sp. EMRT-2]|nr:hypothetical protein FA702_17035 [Novosphingobium sp. EMRT-2]
MATTEVCRRHGISTATLYTWKPKYGGLEVSEARRLRTLEEENARLKNTLAKAILDNAVLKDLPQRMVTSSARREGAARACEHHVLSERRACQLVGVSRRVVRDRSKTPARPVWATC